MEKVKNVFEITVKMDSAELANAVEEAFFKKQKDIKLDGFRKGKVPFDVYVKKIGKQSLYMDAVDIMLPVAYKKALDENKLIPIIQPKVDIKKLDDEGVEFLFVITTMPDVEIKKYKGLNVKKEEVKVTDEEINDEISNMLKRYSELKIKESGSVEEGNVAVIDFEGFLNGKAFDGGKGENYALEIGSHTFIPGFEEQVIGMNKGEERDINVTFPEDYQSEELKGKEVVFKIKVNEIKEKVNRELDEEFFEDLGMDGVNSRETLEEEIRKNLTLRKEEEAENAYIDSVLEAIAKNTTVDIPEEMIDDEIHHMIHRFEEQMRMQGISLDMYMQITKTTHEDLHKQMEPEARKHVLYRFILDTIKEKEKISVDLKEAEKEALESAKRYNMEKDEFLKAYGGIDMLVYELEMKKVIDFLKENN